MSSKASFYRGMRQACNEMISMETGDNLTSARIDSCTGSHLVIEDDDFLEEAVKSLSEQIPDQNSKFDENDLDEIRKNIGLCLQYNVLYD